jgi:hypothetical protein
MNMVRRDAGSREATIAASVAVVCDYFRLEIAQVDVDAGIRLKSGDMDAQVASAASVVAAVLMGEGVVEQPERAWAEGFLQRHGKAISELRQVLLSDGSVEGVLVHAIVASAVPDSSRTP